MNKAEFLEYLTEGESPEYSHLAECAMHRDWPEEGWYSHWLEAHPEIAAIQAKLMDEGGGMDEGSNYYAVYKFTLPDGDEFALRFQGWYASHYGADYEDFTEVKPQKKEITVWV